MKKALLYSLGAAVALAASTPDAYALASTAAESTQAAPDSPAYVAPVS